MDHAALIIEAGKRMLRQGETIGTWGNISSLDPEKGEVYITPSGMAYDALTAADIVVLTREGEIIRGDRRPSVETELHLSVYRARPECRAVIHTHPVYSTAFSAMGEDIPIFLDEAAQTLGDTVKTARYAMPGSRELAEYCVEALGTQAMACLLRSHGAVCIGETMEKAFTVSAVLESTARILMMIRAMGGTPETYSAQRLIAMKDFMKNKYGQI